jgi:hypothetical protein
MTCRACNGAVPDEAQFCPHCDIPIPNASSQPTVYTPPPGSDPRIGGRFPPGMLLGGPVSHRAMVSDEAASSIP